MQFCKWVLWQLLSFAYIHFYTIIPIYIRSFSFPH
jgi:hypothetical protein